MCEKIELDSHQEWKITVYDGVNTEIYSARHPLVLTEEEAENQQLDLYSVKRYWERRNEFWPNFDKGIKTDIVGLFSVTPWDAACQLAFSLDQFYPSDSPNIIDACCGVGGNTNAFCICIQSCFAIGVDLSAVRLMCAVNNAGVCGVDGRASFVMMDAIDFVRRQRNTARFVFCSPPWGGPGYEVKGFGDLPFDIKGLFDAAKSGCVGGQSRLALFLPRDFPIEEAKKYAPKGTSIGIIDVKTGKKKRLIGKCFMFGKLKC